MQTCVSLFESGAYTQTIVLE